MLPNQRRLVANIFFIIEGFTHEEISSRLGISRGTSKSNLARGRLQLQKKLLKKNQTVVTRQTRQVEESETGCPATDKIEPLVWRARRGLMPVCKSF